MFTIPHRTLIGSILSFWLGMLFSCQQNEIEEVQAFSEDAEIPDRSSYGVELTYSDSGRKKMKLFASKMEQFTDKQGSRVEFREGFKVLFYGEGDSVKSRMKAEKGTLYEGEDRMVARNDVVVHNSKGERLNTELLIWERDSGKVHTDRFVKITREDGVIHGNGLVAEEDLSSYKIREITGEWYFDRPQEKEEDETGS